MPITTAKTPKVYVAVRAEFTEDGTMLPREITWEDGEKYEIESLKASKFYQILLEECHKHNIILDNEVLFSYMREYPKKYEKISLF